VSDLGTQIKRAAAQYAGEDVYAPGRARSTPEKVAGASRPGRKEHGRVAGASRSGRKEHGRVAGASRSGRKDLRGCKSCRKKLLAKMKPAPPAARIGAVVTACNEGEEVGRTVESLRESVRDAALGVWVVDDGSSDGSCEDVTRGDVRVLRHDKPNGVGISRNDGCARALEAGADVVTFHDAHMRFPEGVLEALAQKAVESGAIVCSKAKGWWNADGSDQPFVAWGADLHWNLKYGLQPKYRTGRWMDAAWGRVPCPMGACYVISRETIARLSEPTGRLWDDVAGRWGFSEQALAVKAFLLDVPVLVSRDLPSHHQYRRANPVPNAGLEVWKNACFSMAALLSPETFEERFRAYCETYLGAKAAARLAEQARAGAKRSWTPRDEQRIFTHLCGRSATITSPHDDHCWLTELSDVVSARRTQHSGLSVLQWRPGESTLRIKHLLPEAEVTCIEWVKHRATNWLPLLRDVPGLRLTQATLDAWPDPAGAGLIEAGRRFDLITIGGEMQEQCRAAAERLLAPGGRILVNPTADRLVIADEFRTEAQRQLDAHRTPKPHADAPAVRSAAKPTLTVCLLNWRRAENIGPILECLERQSAAPRVLLWDNGAGEPDGMALHYRRPGGELVPIEQHPLVDLAVRPSRNLGCFPRWWLAATADTEYVCSMDDDLLLTDERFLEDAVAAHRKLCQVRDGIVGLFGVRLVPGKNYKDSRHFNGRAREDTRVDIVKGRFMLLPKRLLARVPLAVPGVDLFEDDVYLSLCIGGGQGGAHMLPASLSGRWRQLGKEDGRSASLRPGHYAHRDEQIRKLTGFSSGRPEAAR